MRSISGSRSNWATALMTFMVIFSGGAGEIDSAKSEAVDAYADLFELCDGCANIDGITAQLVKLSHDQNIALFHFVEQSGETITLRNSHGARDGFSDDAV